MSNNHLGYNHLGCVCRTISNYIVTEDILDNIFVNKCYFEGKYKERVVGELRDIFHKVNGRYRKEFCLFAYNVYLRDGNDEFLISAFDMDSIFELKLKLLNNEKNVNMHDIMNKCNYKNNKIITDYYLKLKSYCEAEDDFTTHETELKFLLEYFSKNLTPEEMYKLLLYCKTGKEMSELIVTCKFKPTIKNIEVMYEINLLYNIKFIVGRYSQDSKKPLKDVIPCEILSHLLNYKVQPSDKLVNNIIECICCYDLIANMGHRYVDSNLQRYKTYGQKGLGLDDQSKHKYTLLNATQYFKLLAQYGYNLNLNQICYMIEHNVYVDNLSEYGINPNDPELQKFISYSKYNPYSKEINATLDFLQNKCKFGIELKELKEYCKTMTPDATCLLNAIELNSTQIVKYLICDKMLPVNLECLERVRRGGRGVRAEIAGYIINRFCECYKENMKELEGLREYKKLNEQIIPKYTLDKQDNSTEPVNYDECSNDAGEQKIIISKKKVNKKINKITKTNNPLNSKNIDIDDSI